jgi:tyrosyl-tRNA synthetase
MGKTEKGALFLDPTLTSPYDFFQYWRNVQDPDVERFLLMYTFLPTAEIRSLCGVGKNPNEAKERLAWEITALIHGKEEADRALSGARAAFGGGGDTSAMPSASLDGGKFAGGYNVVDLFFDAGLAPTKSEVRRLVQQGGAFVSRPRNNKTAAEDLEALTDVTATVGEDRLDSQGELILRGGKKRYCRVVTR